MIYKTPEHFCFFIHEQSTWSEKDRTEIEAIVLRSSIKLFRNISEPDWMMQSKYRIFWDCFDPIVVKSNQCPICKLLLPKFIQTQKEHRGILRFSHSEFYMEQFAPFVQLLLANQRIKKIYLLLLEEQGPHDPVIDNLWRSEQRVILNQFLSLIQDEMIEYATLYEVVKDSY
jgi:hypothetical protein